MRLIAIKYFNRLTALQIIHVNILLLLLLSYPRGSSSWFSSSLELILGQNTPFPGISLSWYYTGEWERKTHIHRVSQSVTKAGKREHITPILRSLHWIPVSYRTELKVLLTVYKSLNGQGPKYLYTVLFIYVYIHSIYRKCLLNINLSGLLDLQE